MDTGDELYEDFVAFCESKGITPRHACALSQLWKMRSDIKSARHDLAQRQSRLRSESEPERVANEISRLFETTDRNLIKERAGYAAIPPCERRNHD